MDKFIPALLGDKKWGMHQVVYTSGTIDTPLASWIILQYCRKISLASLQSQICLVSIALLHFLIH